MEKDQAAKFMQDLLRHMRSKGASDLFITADFPPALHSLDAHIGVVAAQLNDALALGQRGRAA